MSERSRVKGGAGGMRGTVRRWWAALNGHWEAFLLRLPAWLSPWVRDFVDVGLTVLAVIVVLKIIFRADMLVPLVVVTSGSMVHESGDDSWLAWMGQRGIQPDSIRMFPMGGGFNIGDMILVKDPDAVLGDVVIYERDLDHMTFSSRDPIIHRVVGVAYVRNFSVVRTEGTLDCMQPQTLDQFAERIAQCQGGRGYCPYTRYPSSGDFRFFITKGDHNEGSDQCSQRMNISYPVNDAQVTGRALLRLPFLGWPKLILNIIYRIVTFQI